jgi:hypothetical protein
MAQVVSLDHQELYFHYSKKPQWITFTPWGQNRLKEEALYFNKDIINCSLKEDALERIVKT